MAKETYISIVVMMLLAGIGTAIGIKQFYFSPAVLSIQQVMPDTGGHSAAVSEPPDRLSVSIPAGMSPMTSPETFGPETLYEKINGKAELYLSAGFKNLFCHRMKSDKAPHLWVEMFVYEMDSDTNAFAVYSRQRRSDGVPHDIATNAYQTENAIFLTHGPFYIEIVGSEPSDPLRQSMLQAAALFIKERPVENQSKPEFDLFPKQGLVKESMSIIPSNAFGYERLDNVYAATYALGDKQATLFISNRQTETDARELFNGYEAFLKMFGGTRVMGPIGIDNALLMEIFGTYELFFTKGPYLCGVHESEDPETAKQMAADLFTALTGNAYDQR